MTQTVGAFVPLQLRSAGNPSVTQAEWPGSTHALGPAIPPTHTVSWEEWPGSQSRMAPPATQRALAALRNPGWWDPRYASGYQGFKFYNPDESGYQGFKFYNPGENEYAGAESGYDEVVALSKTIYVPHPKSRKSEKVTIREVRQINDDLGEVDVGDGYMMLWDVKHQRPHISTVQRCPPGYRLYKGRCFRAGGGRQTNPMHPVYLNTWSLPWSYPWAYTRNPRTLQWGYTHPRWGYRTPWSGWGGYWPTYPGRAYYDDRTVCERVNEDESCPTGTVVERDRDGNKLCCEPPDRNIWQTAVWPTYYWWCPGCGYYPPRHHRHHHRHGAHGGPRETAVVGGSGMIRQGGGVRMGGSTGVVGGSGRIGQSGGARGRNPGYEEEGGEVIEEVMERAENPCNACNVRVPTGPVDMRGKPAVTEEVIENPHGGAHGGGRAPMAARSTVARSGRPRMPWEITAPCPPGTQYDAQLGACKPGKEPCGPDEVYDPVLGVCKTGKVPAPYPTGPGKPPVTCGPNEVYDPVLGICKPGKQPLQPGARPSLHSSRTTAAMRGRLY